MSLAVTYSRIGTPTLPSALARFTSEFGKGSGGSTPLLPPGKTGWLSTIDKSLPIAKTSWTSVGTK